MARGAQHLRAWCAPGARRIGLLKKTKKQVWIYIEALACIAPRLDLDALQNFPKDHGSALSKMKMALPFQR